MSHRCSEAITQVYPYLDEELGWYRRFTIRWHLRRCWGCDCAFAFEWQLKQVIRERMAEEPPPELVDRLRTFLRSNGVEGI